jgi:hypothetical protein
MYCTYTSPQYTESFCYRRLTDLSARLFEKAGAAVLLPSRQSRGSCLVEKAGNGVLLLHSKQKAHVTVGSLTVCQVEKTGAGLLFFHIRQEVHVTGELSYLSAWLRRQELVYFSSTVDKRFMSQVAQLPVCLVEKTGAGVLFFHSRQKAPSHHS